MLTDPDCARDGVAACDLAGLPLTHALEPTAVGDWRGGRGDCDDGGDDQDSRRDGRPRPDPRVAMGVSSTIGAAGGVGARAAAIDSGPAGTRARLAIPQRAPLPLPRRGDRSRRRHRFERPVTTRNSSAQTAMALFLAFELLMSGERDCLGSFGVGQLCGGWSGFVVVLGVAVMKE